MTEKGKRTPLSVLSFAKAAALAGMWFIHAPCALPCAHTVKAKPMITLVETDNDRTVDLRLGETVRISLPENATTGYRWSVESYDAKIITLVANEPHYEEHAIGSGGETTFVFQGKKAGKGQLMLKLWRSWEGDSSVTSRFHIRVHVQ
jgi:inhibitor of cysteine peptidase